MLLVIFIAPALRPFRSPVPFAIAFPLGLTHEVFHLEGEACAFGGADAFGGGGHMTPAQTLIGEVVSPKERGKFQDRFGAIFAFASDISNVLSRLAEHLLGQYSTALAAIASALRIKPSSGTGICR